MTTSKPTNRPDFFRSTTLLALFCVLVGLCQGNFAADRLLKSELKDGTDVRTAFRDVVRNVNHSMVDVRSDGHPFRWA